MMLSWLRSWFSRKPAKIYEADLWLIPVSAGTMGEIRSEIIRVMGFVPRGVPECYCEETDQLFPEPDESRIAVTEVRKYRLREARVYGGFSIHGSA